MRKRMEQQIESTIKKVSQVVLFAILGATLGSRG